MFIHKMKIEVNAHEVVDVVRLLGRFGLKFEISNEYYKIDDLDPDRKNRFRKFVIFGTRKQLAAFGEARRIIYNYHLH